MRNLHAAYTSLPKLRCVFFTIVIRNQSLQDKYPGGRDAFINEHGGQCNDHITIYFDMGGEIEDVFKTLDECEMERKTDFAALDAGLSEMLCSFKPEMRENPFPVDTGVDWLKGQYWNGNVWVTFSE